MSIPIRYILQAIEMENKKIFISGIDTKLGFHLVQKLRDDHLDLQNYSYLVGSSDSPIRSQNTNTAIHAIVNFKKDPALLGKAVLESDVIILDIRNATDEAEYIIKLIQWKAKERKQENNNGRVSLEDQINKNYVIIGIGSHMTWAHEKSTLAKLEGNDKQQAIAKFIAFDYQKQEKIKETDRNKRITHHSWMRERQIEKSLLALNKKSCVRSCILTTGLFYGKDFPSNEISNIVAKCFSLDEEVYVYGQGNNYMPTVHVDDFCEHLDLTIKLLQEKTSVNPLNLISVDENLCTQQEIAETLLKCSGFIKEIKKKQLVYLTKIQDLHSWSVPLLRSTIFNRLPTKSKSFCKYFCQNFSEITEYVELENYHYVLYSQVMQQQIIQQLDTHLTGLIQVFREQDVTAQISKMRSNPKQEIDIHQVSRAIEQGFLKLHNQQSYVLILNQILLDVEVVKKYNLRKFQLGEVPEILRPKFQLPVLDAQLTSENPDHDNQTNQQQVEKQENTGMKIHKQQQKQKQQMNDKQQDVITKRNKKYAQKVDQYLLDNVNCYLSQAFFLLRQKQEPTLPEFIQALKTIYSRQMRVYDEQIKI